MNVFFKRWSSDLDCSNGAYVRARLLKATGSFLKGLLLVAALFSVGVSAQTISPQMIQQLQGMPRAQQEALAKQYGVDLEQILGGGGGMMG